jgi:hypothetical protein
MLLTACLAPAQKKVGQCTDFAQVLEGAGKEGTEINCEL